MKAILALLSVNTEQEGIELLTSYNAFLSDVRAATGVQDLPAALSAVQRNASLLRQLELGTGKQGQAALDAALAWKAPAEQSSTLATQVATLEADKTTRERDSYIALVAMDRSSSSTSCGGSCTSAMSTPSAIAVKMPPTTSQISPLDWVRAG